MSGTETANWLIDFLSASGLAAYLKIGLIVYGLFFVCILAFCVWVFTRVVRAMKRPW